MREQREKKRILQKLINIFAVLVVVDVVVFFIKNTQVNDEEFIILVRYVSIGLINIGLFCNYI